MAQQPEDKQTADIFEHPALQADEKAKREAEELHLAEEHALVPVRAFIKDPARAEKKSKGAERVAKHRAKQAEAGLVSLPIPKEAAEAIKATEGGWHTWLALQKSPQLDLQPAQPPTPQPAPKPEPVRLTAEQERLIALGRRVEALRGWRRLLVSRFLG